MEMCHFSEKKTLREQPQTKNSLKVIFCEFDMSKIPENVILGQKKAPAACPAQTKIALKHISEYSRPISDQIPYKDRYFYMKNHKNRQKSMKNDKKIKFL